MPRYKIYCFPSQQRYVTEIKADTFEEALKQGEEEANQNCDFYADENDSKEI